MNFHPRFDREEPPHQDPEDPHPSELMMDAFLASVAASGKFSTPELCDLLSSAYANTFGKAADYDMIAAKISMVCGIDIYDDEENDH